jgi:hypothetical protein
MKSTRGLLGLGAVFALLMVLGLSGEAFAFGWPPPPPPHPMPHPGPGWHHGPHHGFGGFGLGFSVAPSPSGYYQTVTETVMVAPESVEQYWVPPVFNTVTDASGNAQQVKVRDGYMASRVIPARYETITRQVWVPCGGPVIGVGLGLRF